jgi:hypothetical protein
MTRADLTALIARVEAATGPDREVDADIAVALNVGGLADPVWKRLPGGKFVDRGCAINTVSADRYTASLDAAMALVPSGVDWLLDSGRIAIVGRRPAGPFTARAATPALALTAAALRARLASMGDDA